MLPLDRSLALLLTRDLLPQEELLKEISNIIGVGMQDLPVVVG